MTKGNIKPPTPPFDPADDSIRVLIERFGELSVLVDKQKRWAWKVKKKEWKAKREPKENEMTSFKTPSSVSQELMGVELIGRVSYWKRQLETWARMRITHKLPDA